MSDAAPQPVPTREPPAGDRRGILSSAAALASLTVIVKLAAFSKDWLVAQQYGAGDALDAFLVAFLLPTYAIAVLAGSFASAFLPTYIRLLERSGRSAATHLVNAAVWASIVVLVPLTLVLVATSGRLFPWIGEAFDAEKLALTRSLFFVLAGTIVASGLSAVFGAVLNAHHRFAATALAPIVIPAATIAAIWLGQDRLGVFALALGTLVGFCLECVIVGVVVAWHGWWSGWQTAGAETPLRQVGSQYLPMMCGSLLMSGTLLVNQSMAASLGSGNVSVLNYGNKIVALAINLLAVSLSTVLFPRFSRMIAAGQWASLKTTLRQTIRTTLLVSIPLTLFLALLAEPLVALLFERGAFTPESTRAVSQVQFWLALQVPFSVLAMLGYRVLSALDSNRILLRISLLNLLVNVAGNVILMNYFGVRGIAMSTSLMYVVTLILVGMAVQSRIAEAAEKHTIATR